jgi:hypothetical protein
MRSSLEAKRDHLLERIRSLEEAIVKADEYLLDGRHAAWHGFQPHLTPKLRDGRPLPPHPDWVRTVFLRNAHRNLSLAERQLERLEAKRRDQAKR